MPASQGAASPLFHGINVVAAAPDRLWQMLQDPVVLSRVIPGLSDVEQEGDTLRGRLSVSAGPVRGTFKTTLRLVGGQPPESLELRVEGRNLMGTATLEIKLACTDLGEGSRVSWEAAPHLSGLLSRLGGGLIERKAAEEGAAQRYGDQFFSRLSQEA